MDLNNILTRLKSNFTGEISDILFSSIIDQAPDIIYVTDLEVRAIVFVNSRIAVMLGLSQDEVYEKGFDFFPDHVHPDDYLKRMEQMSTLALQNEDEPIEIEARMETKDGSYRWFRISERIFSRNADGQPEKLIGIATDIHPQKLAEEESKNLTRQLFKKNRELKLLNNEIETIHNIASSEFRDILQTMYTCLEYVAVKDATHFSNVGKANIRKAQSYTQKLRLTMHDLTAYLQLNKVIDRKQNIDLNQVFHEAIHSLPKNEFPYSISNTRLPWVKGNSMLLTLLFKNLLENAVKFRNENEIPAIKIHYVKADEINFHPLALSDTPYHILSVKDNGIGFNKEEAERIFAIFYRIHGNKYRGAGMGLAVCKKIMELHGGFVEADSLPEQGATFTCYFPEEPS
jgi:PAS domain S-box-containing protein